MSGAAVHLQDAVEARQDVHRMAAPAPRRTGEDDRRGIIAVPATIIAGQFPNVAGPGSNRPGIQDADLKRVE